jgi:hypothetical protein
MSIMTTEIQDKAREAYDWFEIAKRDEADPESSFVRLKDGAPEWITQLVYDAHGNFLPDDWRYDKIQDALEFIMDVEYPDDGNSEFADGAVDIYTADRIKWLGSNLNRVGYCDEAAEEFGWGWSPGNVDNGGIVELIGLGQYAEAEEIYASVLNSLTKQTED